MSRVHREVALEEKGWNYAESRGWFQCKFTSPSKNGMPDRFHIRNSRVVFIEYKKPGEVPTKQQALRHKELRAQGAEVHWVDNFEQVKAILI